MLVDAGAMECGLGSRDVLRLEAGLMLHGSDMTIENNPYEAGLALDWCDRIGRNISQERFCGRSRMPGRLG